MKPRLRMYLLFIVLAIIVSACGGKNEEATHQHELPNGDLQETTASAEVLPTFLDGQSDYIRLIYEASGKATDILQWMPCYCGCGESAGHKSNLNCFIHEVKDDGSIVWDDHGTRCGVCMNIAYDSIRLAQEGYSMKQNPNRH